MIITTLLIAAVLNQPADEPAHRMPANDDKPVDRALAFDGRDDFATIPECDAMSYPGQGGWTFELWVKPIAYPDGREITIMGHESVGVPGRDAWSLRIHPTYFEFRIDGQQGNTDRIVFDAALGAWQHVACVFHSSAEVDDTENTDTDDPDESDAWMAVYINGTLVERRQTRVVIESRRDPVYFGALSGRHFRGLIDEPRVWTRAIEGDQLAAAMVGAVDESDPSLRGWWTFDEPRGALARDRSRHANDAILGRPTDPRDGSTPTRVRRAGP